MSKVIFVMDTPDECMNCPMCNGNDECVLQDEDANAFADTWADLEAGCPLVPMPEKKQNACTHGFAAGWNACIDVISAAVSEESEE